MSEFLDMGGYAPYVWVSYLLGLVVVVINWWQFRSEERRVWRRLERRSEYGDYADGNESEAP